MTAIAELERRVQARWVVAKLGRVSAVQEEHGLRLERIETRLDRIDGRLDRIEGRLDRNESEFAEWRRKLPGMIAETMREVLREHKDGAA